MGGARVFGYRGGKMSQNGSIQYYRILISFWEVDRNGIIYYLTTSHFNTFLEKSVYQ